MLNEQEMDVVSKKVYYCTGKSLNEQEMGVVSEKE